MTDKMCMNCKYREKPTGKFPQRGWCSNPKSPSNQSYVYKGDSCDEFAGKGGKRSKAKKEKKESNEIQN